MRRFRAGTSTAAAGARATSRRDPTFRRPRPSLAGLNTPDLSATSRYRGRLRGFGISGFARSWYSTSSATIPCVPSPRVEHERRSERPEAVQVRRIETARRMREADVAHGAGRVGPPRVDGAVGQPEVAGEVAEEVEGQRRRREEIGPQSLVVEALVRLDGGRPRPHRVERAGGDEVRARSPARTRAAAGSRRVVPAPSARGAIGCEPMGCPLASRHCAWW